MTGNYLRAWGHQHLLKKYVGFTIFITVIFSSFFAEINGQSAQRLSVEGVNDRFRGIKRADLDSISFDLFIHHWNLNDIDSAIYFARLARDFAEETRDSVFWMRAEYALGRIHKDNNDFIQAINHYLVAREISIKEPDKEHSRATYLRALNGLGLSNYLSGRLDLAVEYFLESLQEREKDGDFYNISVAQNNLGLVFYQMREFERAKSYYEDAMESRLLSSDPSELEDYWVNIGLSLSGMADDTEDLDLKSQYQDEAKDYFHRAITRCADTTDTTIYCKDYMVYEAYNGMGMIYSSMGKYDSSMLMHNMSMELATNNQNEYNTIKSLINISITMRAMNQYSEALKYSRKAISKVRAQETETNLIQLTEIHKELSVIHKQLGNIDSAFYHLEQYDEINNQVFSTTISSALEKWATKTISARDDTIQAKINEQEAERQRNQLIIIVSVIIILLTSLFIVVLYRSNTLRKRANLNLTKANRIIEEKNNELQNVNIILEDKVKDRTSELKISNEALRQSNLELDNFIYKTSHDIRGPLATLQGICNVALIDVEDKKAVDYLEKLSMTATKLNEILSKLLIINQINNSVISKKPINIQHIIQQTIKENLEKISDKHIETKINVDEGIIYKGDEDLVRIITGNLVNNAFKYYKKSYSVQSFVQVRAYKTNLHLVIEVIDNGVGVEDKAQSKIFEIFSKATEMSDSAGLGLYLVKLSVEKLRGRIVLKKSKEGYTCFNVELPLQINDNEES